MRRRGNEACLAAVLGAAVLCAAQAPAAFAERADRDKPINIESDSMVADDAKKTATFDGKVVLTQGSLTIRADRIIVRRDNEGFQYGVAIGNPAIFRQKREGYDEYFSGEALKIEYDGRVERVEFFNNARLRRGGGDDVRGNYISYDAKTEHFTVKSRKDVPEGSRDGRVHVVIMPKNKEPAAPATVNPRRE
jgi:lipopolysaccharide export system protein LptA